MGRLDGTVRYGAMRFATGHGHEVDLTVRYYAVRSAIRFATHATAIMDMK